MLRPGRKPVSVGSSTNSNVDVRSAIHSGAVGLLPSVASRRRAPSSASVALPNSAAAEAPSDPSSATSPE